jgi:threonyl-tRNA synthetase
MIHRVVFGSIERFIDILIEHYAGKFPVWLAPVQVKVLPISSAFIKYAALISDQLKAAGIRCELDLRDEKLGYKIREARLDKVPYMLVIGKNEQDSNTVSVRGREEGDLGNMLLDEFRKRIDCDIDNCSACWHRSIEFTSSIELSYSEVQEKCS